MSLVILRDDVEPTYWMHCQYGHHHTCGGLWERSPLDWGRDAKPECACACHEPARQEIQAFAVIAAAAAYIPDEYECGYCATRFTPYEDDIPTCPKCGREA